MWARTLHHAVVVTPYQPKRCASGPLRRGWIFPSDMSDAELSPQLIPELLCFYVYYIGHPPESLFEELLTLKKHFCFKV